MRLIELGILIFLSCLTGCTVDPASLALADAYNQFRADLSPNKASPGLNPNFNYLRVQVDKREVFMALGYVDNLPDGKTEVWYSALGEVLRLRDGRLVGATMNMGTDWLSVSFSNLPRWDQIGSQAVFERSRDISPGYQYGVREKMHIQPILQPKETQLKLIQPSSLTWFEERAEGAGTLPPVRYAVRMSATPLVVYAEQCLSSDFCFSWQRWTQNNENGR